VIDVGIHYIDNQIKGDVAQSVRKKASFLTPVPGGVGPLTVRMLAKNTIRAWENNC